jgi:DNA polymerase (family 10)
MADLMEVVGDSAFRIRAFRRVAEALEALPEPVAAMLRAKTLQKVPGVGKGAIARIQQILETGDCDDLRRLRQALPPGLLQMLRITGVGPKTVALVYNELGIGSIDQLEAAAREGHLAQLPRLGERSQQKLIKAIEAYRRRSGRIPLGQALPEGMEIVEALRSCPGVERVELAGSTRRRRETIGDLDLLVAAAAAQPVMDRFVALPRVEEVLLRGETKCSVRLASALQVDLRVIAPESFGAALHYFTGSQMHNIAIRDRGKRVGLRINEYGVYREPEGERLGGATEQEVFAAVALPWIPPELREDRGEIEAAERGALPRLIEQDDLVGDLHVHTDASDGTASAEQMARAAADLGRQYLAITDHSRSPGGGIDLEQLGAQTRELRRLEDQLGSIRLLSGVEVDILSDGTLDFDPRRLVELDWVIASVHIGFEMTSHQMTERIARAMRTGVVDCIGHPSGRLLGERDPYPVDLDQLLRQARELGVAMELNAHPSRMDLDAGHCRQARELGVPLAICTDAHRPQQLERVEYGIFTARRGWIEAQHVLNTGPWQAITDRRRQRLADHRLTSGGRRR